MKKILLFSLMLLFVLTMTACGTSSNGDQEKEESQPESTENTGSTEKKTLKVATDAAYAPFEYMDKGEIVGFDVDFLNAVAQEAGYEIEIVHVGWEPLFVEIQDNISDLAVSAITINAERQETYDFSVPYFLSTNKILIPEGSDIKSASDLKDKVVAVQNGTTGQESAEKILGKNNPNIKKFENNVLAIMELLNGGADAVVADNTVIEEYAKNNPDKKLIVIDDAENFDKEFYGLMFPKGSALKADFDKAINSLYENGTYAKIYEEWFGAAPDIDTLKAEQ